MSKEVLKLQRTVLVITLAVLVIQGVEAYYAIQRHKNATKADR
jgi:hypothetical protein